MSKPIRYADAWLALHNLKTPSLSVAVAGLHQSSAALRVGAAIAWVYPKNFRKRLKPLQSALDDLRFAGKNNEPGRASAVISQLINETLFPLDDAWLSDEMMDFSDDLTIHLAVQDARMSMDDFAEWISMDPSELPDHLGIYMMIGLLWGWFDTDCEIEVVWKLYNQRFQWGVPAYPHFPTDRYIDIRALRRRLKKAGAQSLCTLLLAADGSTNNVFFDYDYEYYAPISLSTASLLALHKDWGKALPLIDECQAAFDLLGRRPEMYRIFLEAYGKSLRPRERIG
jgi:hypothetical protein